MHFSGGPSISPNDPLVIRLALLPELFDEFIHISTIRSRAIGWGVLDKTRCQGLGELVLGGSRVLQTHKQELRTMSLYGRQPMNVKQISSQRT